MHTFPIKKSDVNDPMILKVFYGHATFQRESHLLMQQHMSTLHNIYAVHWGVCIGDAKYTGGCHEYTEGVQYTRGYHEYTVGYPEYTGECSVYTGVPIQIRLFSQ